MSVNDIAVQGWYVGLFGFFSFLCKVIAIIVVMIFMQIAMLLARNQTPLDYIVSVIKLPLQDITDETKCKLIKNRQPDNCEKVQKFSKRLKKNTVKLP